jgi:Fe-S-cluster containining protein
VMLPYTQQMVRMATDCEIDTENRRWVLEDLTMISRREGLTRSPYVKKGLTIFADENTGEALWVWSFFYNCKHYDRETKQCRNYENRPPICSGFPWYDQPPDSTKALPFDCSYRADQGVPVTLMDKLSRRRIR